MQQLSRGAVRISRSVCNASKHFSEAEVAGEAMKRVLVGMWITIVLLVGLTTWLLFHPGAFLRRFQYVPQSELDSVRAEAQAKIAQSQATTDRMIAARDRQIQNIRNDANRMAMERQQIANELTNVVDSSSESRRQMSTILLDALGHEEPAVRTWAATKVGSLGVPFPDAIPKLTRLLQDENERVREAAQNSLTVLNSQSGRARRNQ